VISRVGNIVGVGVLQSNNSFCIFKSIQDLWDFFLAAWYITKFNNTFHVVNNTENMHVILYIRSCQSKYIQIYSFCNEITKKLIFSAAHDSCSNNWKSLPRVLFVWWIIQTGISAELSKNFSRCNYIIKLQLVLQLRIKNFFLAHMTSGTPAGWGYYIKYLK